MTPKLKITLLGGVAIHKGKKAVAGLPSRAAEALFIYLACNRRAFTREILAELLWADRSSAQGLTNLRTILTSLRRELEDYLVVSRDALAFNTESNYWLDAAEFEKQLKEMGLPERGSISNEEAAAKLQSAMDLYQGDFLEGFYLRDGLGFEEWTILQRERLKRFARDGFRLLSSYYLETGNYYAGEQSASRWLRLDPYDEDACRTQMWLFIRTGQRSAALQSYQNLKDKLQQDLGVTPSMVTTDLFRKFQQIDFPPATTMPLYSTGFLGRRQELEDLERLLVSKGTRLVTIAGQGGIGKTRLAVEAARFLMERKPGRFLNGAAFIPLATVETPQDIPARIAESIGLSFHGQDPLQKQLLDFLKDRETLLVLDNLEHLFDDPGGFVALLVDILRSAPGVKLLVTSRERINLYDEVIFDVSGLDVPSTASIEDFSAGALFLQGAQRMQRNYLPGISEKESIAHICRLVEGMPLAIELASAWTRKYSSAEIAAQIESDLDFLASPYKDISAGHRSLRTVFERSWSLLTPDEQTIYTQLTVFRGGFTLDAAKAVVRSESSSANVEIAVAALADKSLLQRQPDERYDIHPLLRQFAAEKLSASGLGFESLSTDHASYYLKFLSGLGDGESPQQRALIRPERDNIHLACERAASSGMLEGLEQTAGILHGFFSVQSWFQEGIDLFQRIMDILAENQHSNTEGLLCDLLGRKARMHTQIGQLEKARADSQQALTYLEHMDDPSRRSRVLDSLAITSYYAGDYQQATILAEQSLKLSEQTSNLDGVAFSLNFLGSCAKAQGRLDPCRDYFERAVAAYRSNKDEIGAAMVLNNLGNLLQVQEDFEGAQTYYLQSSEIFKAQDHIHGAATTLANAGKLAGKRGDYKLAGDLLQESLVLKRKINDQRGEAVSLAGLGDMAMLTKKPEEASQYFRTALEMANKVGDVQLVLDILAAVALLPASKADTEGSRHLISYVLGHSGTSEEARQRLVRSRGEIGMQPAEENVWQTEQVEDVVEKVLNTFLTAA